MSSHKILAIITLATIIVSCGGGKKEEKNHFSLQIDSKNKTFTVNEAVKVTLKNPENINLTGVNYYLGDNAITINNGILNLENAPLGYQTLKAVVNYDNKTETVTKELEILTDITPKIYNYTIVNTYPHDSNAYTQGLEFHKDTMYESTGLRGKSSLRKVDYKTGKVLKQINLDKNIFGEGLTILNNKIYQLTWQSGIGYVYNLATFEKEKTFNYANSKEGWGLCNDGKVIYKSDGTQKIWMLDSNTLAEKGNVQLVTNKSVYSKANELEYVDGLIYANSYQNDGIMIINPKTGAIVGIVDCRGLKDKITAPNKDVLNGIAYNPTTKTFFITGKNWETMFEVTFSQK